MYVTFSAPARVSSSLFRPYSFNDHFDDFKQGVDIISDCSIAVFTAKSKIDSLIVRVFTCVIHAIGILKVVIQSLSYNMHDTHLSIYYA